MYVSRCLLMVFAFALGVLPARSWATHFEVSLQVADGSNKESAGTATEPPKARDVFIRPVMHSTPGTHCKAKWKLTCKSNELLKDVLVHFFVVRVDKLGQIPPPLEPAAVVIETATTMDFAPDSSTSAELEFVPEQPGIYLVRIETQGTAEIKGHEHYSAIDLVVK
jgi:hypothetical protein